LLLKNRNINKKEKQKKIEEITKKIEQKGKIKRYTELLKGKVLKDLMENTKFKQIEFVMKLKPLDVSKVGKTFLTVLKSNTPVKTGRLRSGWR